MRSALTLTLAAATAFWPVAPAFPGDRADGESTAGALASLADRITPAHQEAIDRGVAWLASQQLPNGSFPASPADRTTASSANFQTAVTALGLLSMLGAGHGLRHGPLKDRVARAVEWLLQAQERSGVPGYIRYPGDTQSKMHGHGFATLALAEAYGTAASKPSDTASALVPDPLRELSERLRKGVQAAVECIQASQSSVGGWDYEPGSGGQSSHEGSVTVCQVQALLAATNRGFKVSMRSIDDARRYMKASQSPSGGFRYRISTNGPAGSESWALTAAGITSLLGLAEYDRKEALDRGFEYLRHKQRPGFEDRGYPFYGSFYAVQAYHWNGGEPWERFWTGMRAEILDLRGSDPFWKGQDTTTDLGNVYPTAFCLLMLEVPVGYLSIFAK